MASIASQRTAIQRTAICSGPGYSGPVGAGLLGRRDVLRAGVLGLSGLGLAEMLRCRAAAGPVDTAGSARAIMLVWLGGGHSQLETYDLKPEAPDEYRGPYRPIPTRVPGFDVCELMPRHAETARRLALVRTCTHGFSGHQDGTQHVLTGWPAVLTGGGTTTSIYPEVGAIFKRLRPQGRDGLPNYVAMPVKPFAVGPAYLGKGCEPFEIGENPNLAEFQVPNLRLPISGLARLESRVALRRAFDRGRRFIDRGGAAWAGDEYDREALRLLTGPAAQRAFDLSTVDPRERDRYGRTRAGQSLLLARRLIEAGVGFVNVEVANYAEAGVDGGWDDHATACNIFDRMNRRLPIYDRALTALIDDVYDRGMDRDVLVVVMSEFGRTPRIDVRDGRPGRDHHPGVMSVLFAGGGLRVGQVIGATDARADRPRERPVAAVDVLATIYHCLGIDPQWQFVNHSGRPLAILPEGEVIRELVG